MSGVESGHAFGVPVVFENSVGLKALTIVLSYRIHIAMEVQYLVTLLLLYLLIFGQIRRYNATICQYCGKDFKSLGKHVWRCKSRAGNLSHDGQVSQGRAANGSSSESSNTSGMLQSVNLSSRETDCENYKCYCGRCFKTYRSLNLHRRSCFIQI